MERGMQPPPQLLLNTCPKLCVFLVYISIFLFALLVVYLFVFTFVFLCLYTCLPQKLQLTVPFIIRETVQTWVWTTWMPG